MKIDKVTTKKGDKEKTTLSKEANVSKTDSRVKFLGSLDLLTSSLGVSYNFLNKNDKNIVVKMINELFNVGAYIATDGKEELSLKKEIAEVEEETSKINETLHSLDSFILPIGDPKFSELMRARAEARKVEIEYIELTKEFKNYSDELKIYLNRISDLLFVLARKNCKIEYKWVPRKK